MFKNYISIIAVIAVITLLPGCASIVNGTSQSVSVDTGRVVGATCSLQNNKGTWFVNQTPGSVTVNRSYENLLVNCKKGGMHGSRSYASNTKPMAFGNVLFGGVIGAGVDMADGAAYDYPNHMTVAM